MIEPGSAVTTAASNPVLAALLARHSIRSGYSDRPVPQPVLTEIVRAGLAAPSSKNAQPWRLHVVTDRRLLADFATAVADADGADTYVPHDPATGQPRPEYVSTVRESAAVLRDVAAAIFVENRGLFSNGRRRLADSGPVALRDSLVGYGLEMIGIGAAVENMWIAAQSFGVSVAFMGDVAVAEDTIADRLGVEGDVVGVLALGYSELRTTRRAAGSDVHDPTHVVWHRAT